MDGRRLTCVYCGMRYPVGTPDSGHQVLTDHIQQCEKHPLKKVTDERNTLRRALVGLIGMDTREELELIELELRSAPAPEVDKVSSINAVQALLQTLPE